MRVCIVIVWHGAAIGPDFGARGNAMEMRQHACYHVSSGVELHVLVMASEKPHTQGCGMEAGAQQGATPLHCPAPWHARKCCAAPQARLLAIFPTPAGSSARQPATDFRRRIAVRTHASPRRASTVFSACTLGQVTPSSSTRPERPYLRRGQTRTCRERPICHHPPAQQKSRRCRWRQALLLLLIALQALESWRA